MQTSPFPKECEEGEIANRIQEQKWILYFYLLATILVLNPADLVLSLGAEILPLYSYFFRQTKNLVTPLFSLSPFSVFYSNTSTNVYNGTQYSIVLKKKPNSVSPLIFFSPLDPKIVVILLKLSLYSLGTQHVLNRVCFFLLSLLGSYLIM